MQTLLKIINWELNLFQQIIMTKQNNVFCFFTLQIVQYFVSGCYTYVHIL